MTASPLLARTMRAIHTLFYADERAAARMSALEADIKTDDELAAFQSLSVALINPEPLSPQELAGARAKFEEMERREAERPKTPSERISVEAQNSDEGRYVQRLLEKMYTTWQGTLDYERGVHSFTFFSPFDAELRRHTTFASVSVDGQDSEVRARTYTLGPYLFVKDYRTKRESDDPWGVLNGDLTLILPTAETPA